MCSLKCLQCARPSIPDVLIPVCVSVSWCARPNVCVLMCSSKCACPDACPVCNVLVPVFLMCSSLCVCPDVLVPMCVSWCARPSVHVLMCSSQLWCDYECSSQQSGCGIPCGCCVYHSSCPSDDDVRSDDVIFVSIIVMRCLVKEPVKLYDGISLNSSLGRAKCLKTISLVWHNIISVNYTSEWCTMIMTDVKGSMWPSDIQ
jgi:hypothetical protein